MLDVRPLTAVVLWGGIYPAAKLALRDLPLLSFTWLRIILAMAFLLAAAGRGLGRALNPPRRTLVAAGLAQTAFQLLLVAGVARGIVDPGAGGGSAHRVRRGRPGLVSHRGAR